MTDSETVDDGWEQGSRDEEQSEEGDDDVLEVEASGSRASAKPILRLPERNDEDTVWTRADGTKPASGQNKLTVEFPDTGSVDVSQDRMVDSILHGNVLQVRLLLPLPVDEQVVGV